MTLKHIVNWKLGGETLEERNAQAAEIIAALEPLIDLVPSLRKINVYRNELFDGDNFDVTLITEFDDAEGLAAYATHPDHVAAGAIIKGYAVARVATDFTV
ncbi:Dabb family protein [Leucobacter sp. cx-42]|uniref:Dabb family protein n=1 Tax=unclassified Leucobacter TaxID=2621730 RepID=UPI00165E8B70|nr:MULTISPECIES: Dabb family protein [unclassified Leucobacter]MBC9954008.1 Dabb family protein [Leucobacter sp. cx-42]